VVYPPTGSRPRQGDEHPTYAEYALAENGPFTFYLYLRIICYRGLKIIIIKIIINRYL